MLNDNQIFNAIEKYIAQLKPEIRSKFIYLFEPYDREQQGTDSFAITQRNMRPAVIKFFIEEIRKGYKTEESIKELVSHEVLHVLGMDHGIPMEEKTKKNKLYVETS